MLKIECCKNPYRKPFCVFSVIDTFPRLSFTQLGRASQTDLRRINLSQRCQVMSGLD